MAKKTFQSGLMACSNWTNTIPLVWPDLLGESHEMELTDNAKGSDRAFLLKINMHLYVEKKSPRGGQVLITQGLGSLGKKLKLKKFPEFPR